MTHEPRINVMYEETENLGNFNSRKRSIGIYGIPRSASPEFVADMVDTAEMAIGLIRARLSGTVALPVVERPQAVERRANHRALDEIPIDETGIDITSSTGLGCVVCGDTEGLTEVDLGMVCQSCLADIADDEEGGMIPGDADQNGQPEPVSLAIDPPSSEANLPTAVLTMDAIEQAIANIPDSVTVDKIDLCKGCGAETGESHLPGCPTLCAPGHVEGCHCQDCGFDPFADGADDIPCPQGCQCATCLDKGKKCATCQKEKPDLAIWWRQTDGTLLCNECKGVPSQEMQAPKYESHAKVEETKPVEIDAEPVEIGTQATTETDPRAHVYNGPVCERCGMGEIATTHCPGTVITAAQGQNIVRGLMDYINGGWKVAGAPGNTHKFPGNNEPLSNLNQPNDIQGLVTPGVTQSPTNDIQGLVTPGEVSPAADESLPAGEVKTDPANVSPPKTDKPSEMAATSETEDIPGEDEISTKFTIFGVDVDIPPMEWAKVPITEVSTDGDGGGQLKALNTVLSLIGYKGKDRHWASLAILHAAFGPFRGTLDSLKDLTKAEAHVILSYLDAATPESKVLLFDAACAMKGQIPLRLSPETEVAA